MRESDLPTVGQRPMDESSVPPARARALGRDNDSLSAVGNYDLISKIADGGMGSVFKARQRTSGEVVAIKIVPNNMLNNEVLLKRFEQEFRSASRIDHPNVVRAIEFGHEGRVPYLVMEFVDGESLGERIEKRRRLPEREAINIITQAAQGLHKAHKSKLVHRDVKPDNILINKEEIAKLADLGLVKAKDLENDVNLTKTGRGLGTPHFMAPEQFRNAKQADERCDIYSLGATLYMAVTGELPFRSCSPLDAWMKKQNNDIPRAREIVPTLSERLDWAIARAMSAEPDDRPATCREFVEDLTGRSTRPIKLPNGSMVQTDLWYMTYEDDAGEKHVVKGPLTAIRRGLKDGLLGDAENVRVSRTKEGPYDPLRSHPEFRDLVIQPRAVPLPKRPTAAPAKGSKAPKTPPPVPTPATHKPLAAQAPVYRAPAIDFGIRPEHKPAGTDWVTWFIVILLVSGSFAVGWWFFFTGQ